MSGPGGDGVDRLFGAQATRVDAAEQRPVRRSPVLGLIALAGSIAMLVLTVIAIVLFTRDATSGTPVIIAFVSIWGTIVTFVAGVIAVVANAGRRPGFIAVVLSFFGNPFVLGGILALIYGSGV